MVEVSRDRPAHRFLKTPAPCLRVPAFTEIREVGEQQDSNRVRVVKQKWIVDLDMDTEEIEPGAFRERDIVLQGLDVARGVDSIRVIRLVERAANVDGFAVQR